MKNLTFFTVLLLSLMTFSLSCSSSEENEGEDKKEGNAYLIKASLLFSEESNVITLNESEEKTINFHLTLDQETPNKVTIGILSGAENVKAYNMANRTNYTIAPANTYSFDTKQVEIAKGEKTSSTGINLTLKSSGLSLGETYLIPIEIGKLEGSHRVVKDEEKSFYYLFLTKKEPQDMRLISAKENANCRWDIEFASSEILDGGFGYAECLIDGDESNFWHHDWKKKDTPPFEIIIDMKRNMEVHGVQLTARTLADGTIQKNGVASEVEISVASDISFPLRKAGDIKDSEYKGKTSFNADDLKVQLKNDLFLTQKTEGRYLRIAFKNSYSGETPYAYAGACMAELKLWGKISDNTKPGDIQMEEKDDNVIRLVSYNVFTFRNNPEIYPDGTYDEIANMMKEIQADAICLNEIDNGVPRTQKDQAKHFAKIMGDWDYVFGAGLDPYPTGGKYGEALVTKDKTVKKAAIKLPKGDGGEVRVLCVMELDDYIIMNTHLDHLSAKAHIGQIETINEYIEKNYKDTTKPIFLGGDLNATPESGTLTLLQEKWDLISQIRSTYPSNAPKKCIDYFLAYKNGANYEVVKTKVLKNFNSGNIVTASDHIPIMVDIKLP